MWKDACRNALQRAEAAERELRQLYTVQAACDSLVGRHLVFRGGRQPEVDASPTQ